MKDTKLIECLEEKSEFLSNFTLRRIESLKKPLAKEGYRDAMNYTRLHYANSLLKFRPAMEFTTQPSRNVFVLPVQH